MKSPLWIVNGILMVILIAMVIFIAYSFKNIFKKPPITPIAIAPFAAAVRKEEGKPKDLRLIYEENDLFGTYRPSIMPVKEVETLPVIPRPPLPKPVMPQIRPVIQFLDPLPVKITGIIFSNNEAKSQVTIMNNNTRKTESFRVGDKLLDAYVLRIFPRKIIVIRSNGQQETLFMYAADAQEELKNLKDVSWNDVVQKQNEYSYLVSPTAFATRIHSLAQFLDMLDILTATKQGTSIGLRVGRMDNRSIGYSLGFMPNDIITKINGIAPTSTTNRLKIYNALMQLDMGSEIKVQFTRNGQMTTYTYTLFNLADMTAALEYAQQPVVTPSIVSVPAPQLAPQIPQIPSMALPTALAQRPLPQAPQQGVVPPAHPAAGPRQSQKGPLIPPKVSVAPAQPQGAPAASPKAAAAHRHGPVAPVQAPSAPQIAAPQPAAPAQPAAPVQAPAAVTPPVAPVPTAPVQAVAPVTPAVAPAQPVPQPAPAPPQPTAVPQPTPQPAASAAQTALQTEAAPIREMKRRDYEAMKQFGGKASANINSLLGAPSTTVAFGPQLSKARVDQLQPGFVNANYRATLGESA